MRIRTQFALVFALLLAASGFAAADDGFGSLTVEQVAKLRTQKNVYVYDNNQQARFQKGHVAGARWLNPYEIKAADLPADKAATLIFYCHNEH
jgi:hypothetical protein